MAKEIFEWNLTAAANNFAPADGGMPEGMPRTEVNDSGRERMRALREWYDDPEFLDLMRNPTDGTAFTVTRQSATVVRIASGANDMSAFFNTDRRCRVQTAGVPPTNVFDFHVLSVSYVNPNTDVTIESGSVPVGIDQILLHHSANIKKQAFKNEVVSDFFRPDGFTSADFSAALALVKANGGGVLLLDVGTYTIDTTQIIDHPIVILGKGVGATIVQLNTALDKLFHITGVAATGIEFHDLTLDGNRSAHVTFRGDVIYIDDRATQIYISSVEILGGRSTGIFLDNSSATSNLSDIIISDCTISDTGEHGIGSIDDQTAMEHITVSNVHIDSPGQRFGSSAGIKVTGSWALSNITVTNLNQPGPFTQRGVWFLDSIAASPTEQDAHHCTLHGFVVSGTGAQARGIEVGGRECVVSGGIITLSGGTSRGLFFGGLGGAVAPFGNIVSNVFMQDMPIAVDIQPTADENIVQGCTFKETTTIDVDILGDRNIIRDCHSVTAGADGVVLNSGADDNLITGCHFLDTVGTAIDIESGSVNTRVINITNDGVGTGFADAGTRTIADDVDGLAFSSSDEGSEDDAAGEETMTGMIGLVWPGMAADGARQWTLSWSAHTDTGATNPIARLRVGTAGSIADPLAFQPVQGTGAEFGSGGFTRIFTPLANEVVTSTLNNAAVGQDVSSWVYMKRVRGS